MQLLILGVGIFVGWSLFASETIMLDIHTISSLDFPVPAWFVATMKVSTYSLALIAIDMIDNRIQLGCWQHPVQTQTLLLTRASLASWNVKKKRRCLSKKKRIHSTVENHASIAVKKQALVERIEPVVATHYRRKRTTSEPVTPEMLRRFLRAIPLEVSRSGVLARDARADARRLSEAAVDLTPSRVGRKVSVDMPGSPRSVHVRSGYDVQRKVRMIERAMDNREREIDQVMPTALDRSASYTSWISSRRDISAGCEKGQSVRRGVNACPFEGE